MHTAEETFGISGANLASVAQVDPQANPSPIATTRVQNDVPSSPVKALLDPSGSAIFWIGLAALVGLFMVSGELSIAAKLGGRAGRR